MNDLRGERLSALAGFLLAALLLIRTFLFSPQIPLVGDIRGFFTANGGKLQLQVFLTGIIVIVGTWFFGSLRAYLVRAGADRLANIMFAGWIMQGVLALVRHSFIGVMALVPNLQEPGYGLFALTMAGVMLGFVWICAFIIAAATSVAATQTDAFPAWFAWLTAAAAIVFLLGGLAVSEPHGYFSRVGDYRWIVLYGYVAWAAIASLVLYQRVGAAER